MKINNKLKNLINIKNITGYNILVSGRLKGIQRAKHKKYSAGLVKINTVVSPFQVKNSYLQTK